ncbi:hypothetical protein BKA70DRAFT_310442 [Coprinopsis sp. MPI-PUGE-AT-0042]|nr:hypothetical protein BKA70DRAFT_310442 [Coprinopsis sp. MPI-PUGE-AT-0042]
MIFNNKGPAHRPLRFFAFSTFLIVYSCEVFVTPSTPHLDHCKHDVHLCAPYWARRPSPRRCVLCAPRRSSSTWPQSIQPGKLKDPLTLAPRDNDLSNAKRLRVV